MLKKILVPFIAILFGVLLLLYAAYPLILAM